jgi:hypothetical protein
VHPNKIKKDLVFAVLQMGYLIITEIICRGGWGKKTPLLIWLETSSVSTNRYPTIPKK